MDSLCPTSHWRLFAARAAQQERRKSSADLDSRGPARRGRGVQVFLSGISRSLRRIQSSARGRPCAGQDNLRRRKARRLDGYDSSIVFEVDDTAKTYLEREVGLAASQSDHGERCSHLVLADAFFPPAAKRRIRRARRSRRAASSATSTSWKKPPPARGSKRAAAQAVAESFLRDTLHADLSRYDFREEEANFTERPARRDWSFSWERRGFRAKDAPYRLNVTLAG